MRRILSALLGAGVLALGFEVASAQTFGVDPAGPSAFVSRDNRSELALYDYCEWGGDTQFCTSFFAREVYEEGTGRFQFTTLLLQRRVTAATYNFGRYIVCRLPKRIIRLTAVDASFPLTALDPTSESCETGGYRIDCDENGENCTYDPNYGYTSVIWAEGAWNNPIYISSGQGVSHTRYTPTGERYVYNCKSESRTNMTEGGLTWGPSASTRFIPFSLGVITQYTSNKCLSIAK